MSDSFSYDTGRIRELADDMLEIAKKYLDEIKEVSSNVTSLGSDWQGETYNTFKASYDTNRARIEELADQLNTIAKGLDTVADQGDESARDISARLG